MDYIWPEDIDGLYDPDTDQAFCIGCVEDDKALRESTIDRHILYNTERRLQDKKGEKWGWKCQKCGKKF